MKSKKSINLPIFTTVLIFTSLIIFPALGKSVVRVIDFGAVPDDGKDDTSALQYAISYIKSIDEREEISLVFEPGIYDIQGYLKLGGQIPSVTIEGINNLTIDGQGAELINHNWSIMFAFRNCNNIKIKNLNIDWDPLPFSGGKVLSVGDNYFDYKVIEPHEVKDGLIIGGVLGYDPKQERLAYRGVDICRAEADAKLIGPGVIRVYFDESDMEKYKGHILKIINSYKEKPDSTYLLLRSPFRGRTAITIKKCSDIVITDVNIYASTGCGILAHDSQNFTLRRYKVMIKPGSGRWFSSNADATQFNSCRGTIIMEDCYFEGMGDDATNVYGEYIEIAEIIDEKTIALKRHGEVMPGGLRVGDALEFSSRTENPLQPYFEATIKKIIKVAEEGEEAPPTTQFFSPNISLMVVELSKPLSKKTKVNDIVTDLNTLPVVRIRNCTVIRNRARGFLIKTRDVVIENCDFKDISGNALLIRCDATYYWDSAPTRNIIIRNNRFISCNFGTARREGVIQITAQSTDQPVSGYSEVGLTPVGVHRDITIENNIFRDVDGSAIHVGSADSVVIRNNTMERVSEEAVSIRNSRNVTIIDNKMSEGKGWVKYGPNSDIKTVILKNNTNL